MKENLLLRDELVKLRRAGANVISLAAFHCLTGSSPSQVDLWMGFPGLDLLRGFFIFKV